MAHQIDIDREKGIINFVHSECVKKDALWESHQELLEKIKGMEAPKILMDMRAADLKMVNWEKREFAESHKHLFTKAVKFAVLIQANDPQYNDYLHFETIYNNRGVNLRVFDNEHMAENWLLLPGE